jgi:hypothetical protein
MVVLERRSKRQFGRQAHSQVYLQDPRCPEVVRAEGRQGMSKRYVIQRKSDYRYWAGNLGKHPWMIDMSEARPLCKKDAEQLYAIKGWSKAIPVEVTIRKWRKP